MELKAEKYFKDKVRDESLNATAIYHDDWIHSKYINEAQRNMVKIGNMVKGGNMVKSGDIVKDGNPHA